MKTLLLVLIAMISIEGSLLAQSKKAGRDVWTARIMHAGIDDIASISFGTAIGRGWNAGLSASYRLNPEGGQTWSDNGHQEYSYVLNAFAERDLGSLFLAQNLDLLFKFRGGLGVAKKRETFCVDVIEHVPVLLAEPSLMMRWKVTSQATVYGGFSLLHSPTFEMEAISSLPKGTISLAVGVGL